MKRPALILALWLTLGALMGVASLTTSAVRRSRLWADRVTGSIKGESSWLGLRTTTTVEPSALERWVIEHEGGHTPDWQYVGGTGWDLLDRKVYCGVGMAPETFQIRAGKLSTRFVAASSDSEIREFLRVMREGAREEREHAVEGALDRMFPETRGPDARERTTPGDGESPGTWQPDGQ